MSQNSLNVLLDRMIDFSAQELASCGFNRRGKSLRAVFNNNAEIIEFQKSDKSSGSKIIFTVNLGIVCGDLLDKHKRDIQKASVIDAHLRIRLGMLLQPARDVWWELTESTDCDALEKELSSLLLTNAVPYLDKYKNTDSLIKLWKSGVSPGLTAVQRARFLTELNA